MMPRVLPLLALLLAAALGAAESRPNIVVVIGEDMGPDTGAYGCKDAITPNMDRLAKEGALLHPRVHPRRRLRSFPQRHGDRTVSVEIRRPEHALGRRQPAPRPSPRQLQAAGYHVMWPGKTDFQGVPEKNLANDRKPWVLPANRPAGELTAKPKEPFFAYFNDTVSHESQVRADDQTHAK